MLVKFKKLYETAVIPTKAHETDAGYDLTAISRIHDEKLDAYIYGTGIALEIPYGYVGLLFPRSSNRKTNYYMPNHVGVIDSGYRGEVMLTFKNRDKNEVGAPYKVNDRIGQLIIMPVPSIEFEEVDELSYSDRGANGHGSTGN